MSNSLTNSVAENLEDRTLLFYIDNMLYAASLALVKEILPVQRLTKLPFIPPHVKGIINLRGKVVPIIDTRTKFDLPEIPYTDRTCIIVLTINTTQVGLIVDSVSEVLSIAEAQPSSPPLTSNTAGQYIASVVELNSRVILNIDFARFFQNDIEGLRF